MMLCKELSEDDKNGITFKCIKDCYNMLDIIELEKDTGEDPDDNEEEENPFNPSGYEELAQALRSVIWSNVDVNNGKQYLISLARTQKLSSILFFPFPLYSFFEREASNFQRDEQ
jgi:hypothetical protein